MPVSSSLPPVPRRLAAPFAAAPFLAVLPLALLAACGGATDDGSSSGPPSTVTSANVTATRYGATALVTINGTGLDSSGLALVSSSCRDFTRLSTGSTVSTSTTAYYDCTVAGPYNGSIDIRSNGATLVNVGFTVPAPVVTLTMNNGLGVNGTLRLALAGDKAPTTVLNFLDYVNSGFYAGTIIHRVVADFVFQGGGYTHGPTLKTPTFASIGVEATGLPDTQWSVSMARDGSGNATSQFFVNVVDNHALDAGFPAFGALADSASIATAQAILAAPASCTFNGSANTLDCLPSPDVTIVAATQVQ